MQSSNAQGIERPYVLDASRLIWRLWTGRLPTGIDRVCLAYVQAFAGQSLAMLQSGQRRIILAKAGSDALFALLLNGGGKAFRRRLVALLARAIPAAMLRNIDVSGRIYLNVGHTGLNAVGLDDWLAAKGLRSVFLIHDLIPITHPRYCRPGEDNRHKERMRQALRSASGVIANSHATADELRRFAQQDGLPQPKILVAWLGIESLPQAPSVSPRKRPYFLAIGTIEARKNHMLLLRLWDRLREQIGEATPDLVLIGQRGWEADDVFERLDAQPADGPIVELGHCDDAGMAALVTHARALLMPSFVEGFGLPVLEAMMLGTPVIASDQPVFREIAGDIPRFIAPDDIDGWTEAVQAYLHDDSPEREAQLQRLAGYSPPDWAGHFAKVRDWLGQL